MNQSLSALRDLASPLRTPEFDETGEGAAACHRVAMQRASDAYTPDTVVKQARAGSALSDRRMAVCNDRNVSASLKTVRLVSQRLSEITALRRPNMRPNRVVLKHF